MLDIHQMIGVFQQPLAFCLKIWDFPQDTHGVVSPVRGCRYMRLLHYYGDMFCIKQDSLLTILHVGNPVDVAKGTLFLSLLHLAIRTNQQMTSRLEATVHAVHPNRSRAVTSVADTIDSRRSK